MTLLIDLQAMEGRMLSASKCARCGHAEKIHACIPQDGVHPCLGIVYDEKGRPRGLCSCGDFEREKPS